MGSKASVPTPCIAPGRSARSNWFLIHWITSLSLRWRWLCAQLLIVNVLLLGLGISGISLVGLEIDVIQRAAFMMNPVPGQPPPPTPRAPLGLRIADYQLNTRTILVIALGVVALAGVQMLLRYHAAVSQGKLVQHILIDLRTKVYDKLQRLSFRFFDANQTGSIINRATGDVGAIAGFAQQAVIGVVMLVITLVVYFLFMLQIHPGLTLASLATTPLLGGFSVWFSKRVRPAYVENRRLYDQLILTLSENVQGQHVVKGFARQEAENGKFHQANDTYRHQQRWIFKRIAFYHSMAGFLTQINLLIVLLYGGYLVIFHRQDPEPPLSVGRLIVFAALLQQFSNQVIAISGLANSLQASLTAADRVYEVLDAPLEISSKPAALPLAKARGGVEFRQVSFGYQPQELVLREVNFTVQPGQCVAILGATGSGKSTLLSLIPRFYDPTSGQLLIDGRDARDYELDDLRRAIGLVFQESFLFSNTVAANISFGHPQASREQIEKAARIAAAHDFIMELSKGYDTVIGEQGADLSGGQRQRLAIARAVLLEPSILILDDATAAIDPETEHEILQAMDNAMQGRTTFVVAHRLSTLRRADFVLVLEQGRIVEYGTHEQLLKRRGLYKEVARLQVVDPMSQQIIQARKWYEGEVDSPLIPEEGDSI